MTTIHTDVLVLGSGLAGLVAATYLARARLRVVLFEEPAHAKRPPLLREPFVLSGLESGEPVHQVMRELGVPLVEQRSIARSEIAYQVLIPGARIDVGRGREALAGELAAYDLASAEKASAWLRGVDQIGDEARRQLLEGPRGTPTPALLDRLVDRSTRELALDAALPPVPEKLRPFVSAQTAALAPLVDPGASTAGGLLLRGARGGAFLMPDAGQPFLDLFRRRFTTLHGEIRPLSEFSLISGRQEVGVELPRGRLFASAMLVAAPRELLRRAVADPRSAPGWLKGAPAPSELSVRLFRVDPGALPVGLDRRAIVSLGPPDSLYWLARHRDPGDEPVEWMTVCGPGCVGLDPENPLGALSPFAGGGVVPIDSGPTPVWDRDASDLRFALPRPRAVLRQRPPVVAIGPEVAPDLGFEGEILWARTTGLKLAEKLRSRSGLA